MYCSSCGGAVAQGLSYCNRCGAKFGGAEGGGAVRSSEVKPELLVSSMVRLFVLGLLAISVLIGVLKAVAGFDLPLLLAAATFSFVLLFVVECVLVGLLFRSRRGAGKSGDAVPPKDQTTGRLGAAQAPAHALPEPLPSVTEHTTRLFEPAHTDRQPK